MNARDYYQMGLKLREEGKINLAIEAFVESAKQDYGRAHLELFNFYRPQGNLLQGKYHLIQFLDSPLTPNTLDVIAKVRQELQSIEQQLSPPKQ